MASLFVGVLLAAGCTSGDEGTSPQPSSAPGPSTQVREALGTVSGGLYLSGVGQFVMRAANHKRRSEENPTFDLPSSG